MEQTETTTRPQTLGKAERLCRQRLIDRLFAGGSKSLLAFPLRLVYLPVEATAVDERVSLLISVPKKRFRRAVKRNRVKRQIREAYRRNKYILLDKAQEKDLHLVMAVIWLGDELCPSEEVEKRLVNLLQRLSERMEHLTPALCAKE